MVQLSVIIVNYNVKYFLEQALLSVQKASEKLSVEVFVVDNNSSDGSVEMVKNNFPAVYLIDNQQNTGFSVANNQAYSLATGKYILLLNPDTVVAEDTFLQCYDFMEKYTDAGALGVRMIDGSGVFLPESKRGFPTPFVAFCKTFGLSSFFPTSRIFNQYYLGYKGEWETCEIEVLAGAFMFMRKTALEKVGMLDEAFFMYGEDIDLSYRIVKGNFKNYYLPTTSILHYKGESTKKGSLNYVKTFYQAMIIFAKKHFSGSQGQFFVAMLQVAIYLRAFITLFSNFLKTWSLPIMDAALLFVGMYFLKDYWAISRFGDAQYYQPSLLFFNVPLYIMGWLSSVYFNGGYDKNANVASVVKGLGIGALLLMAVYGLLPSEYRSSRMLLLLGSVWAMVAMIGLRFLGHFLQHKNFNFAAKKEKNLAIIANLEESHRVRQLMFQAQVHKNFIGTISPEKTTEQNLFIGDISTLKNLVTWYGIDELIFCSKDISAKDIIQIMSEMGSSIAYRIVPDGSNSIIGSSSKNEVGELYNTDIQFNISSIAQQRNKRLFDIVISLILLIISPLVIFFIKNKLSFLPTIIQIFFGKKTWIGYGSLSKNLPKIAEGVLTTSIFLNEKDLQNNTLERLDFFYAKDYSISKDLRLLIKNWRKI